MTFLWPEMLWLLLAAPVLVGIYVLLLRRRKKGAVRYASLSLVREAIGPGQRFRRHVPPALFLLAMIATILAIARPSAVITLPSEQRIIVMEEGCGPGIVQEDRAGVEAHAALPDRRELALDLEVVAEADRGGTLGERE